MAVNFDHKLGVLVFDEIASPVALPYTEAPQDYAPCYETMYVDNDGAFKGLSSIGLTVPSRQASTIGSKPSTVKITSNVTSTSTALADVTGLSFSLATTTNYYFKFYCIIQTTATATGLFLSVNGPTATDLCWHLSIPTARTTRVTRFQTTYNGGATTTGLTPANTDFLAILEGSLTTTASVTLIARFASETGTSVSVRTGSCGILYTM